jgi:hypothetical protein
LLCRVVWQKFTDVSEMPAASIIGAESTSEESTRFYQIIWRNNTEIIHLSTRRRENLISHKQITICTL